MKSPYKRLQAQQSHQRPNLLRFPKQRLGTCLRCRWKDKRTGGLYCHECYRMAQVFSPRLSEIAEVWEEAS